MTHLVAGVPLLKVGVGPRTAPNLRCAAVPLYLSSDSIITTAPSPKIHYISHNLHLHPTPLDYLAVCSLTIINPTLSHPHLSTPDTTSLPTHPTQTRYQSIVTYHIQTYQGPFRDTLGRLARLTRLAHTSFSSPHLDSDIRSSSHISFHLWP